MRAADRDRHSADPHRERISRDKPGAMEWLDCNSFIETQFTQPSTVALRKRGPVDTADRGFTLKGKVGKSHLRAIISIV